MTPVGVVTDSTADLAPDFMARWGIRWVPLEVHVGSKTYRDRVEIDPPEFVRVLRTEPALPRTSAPSAGSFVSVYNQLFHEGIGAVISIHISGALSSTVRSAEMAARMADGPVTVIDSHSASLGLGLMVWWAAVRARAGAGVEQIAAEVERLTAKVRLLCAPLTLEYLARGGRIGQAARLIGTVLDTKPVLAVEHGTFRAFRKVRGERQIVPAIVQGMLQDVPAASTVLAAVAHSDNEAGAAALDRELRRHYNVVGALSGMVGPAIAAHVGPGAFGAILCPLTREDASIWEEGT